MLLRELRIKALELKIKGRSKMKKAELIEAIKAKQWQIDRIEQDTAFKEAQKKDLEKQTSKQKLKELKDEKLNLKKETIQLRQTTLKGKERLVIGEKISKIRDRLRKIHSEMADLRVSV